jgi:hypothetical protein
MNNRIYLKNLMLRVAGRTLRADKVFGIARIALAVPGSTYGEHKPIFFAAVSLRVWKAGIARRASVSLGDFETTKIVLPQKNSAVSQ